jgi:Domain of Unknown Function (DUF1080)
MRRLILGVAALLLCGFVQGQSPSPTPSPRAGTTPVEDGFVSIFDGRSLAGWEGDPKYWRVENGALVGEVTPETLLKQNSFIVWRGVTRDFELIAEYRISARGNSGINYRSARVPDVPWALRGYQADIDGGGRYEDGDRYSGQNYEERGRTFLASRGQMARAVAGEKPRVVASLGDTAALGAFVKKEDWNEYHLIVRGNLMIHVLNGHVMSVTLDDDGENRRSEGLLGVQVHVGAPMKVEYRNLRLKTLTP